MANRTILQVLHTLNVGGAEILAAAMARNLSNQFRFEFVCLDELGQMGQSLIDDGFQVHVLNRSPGFDRSCARRLYHIFQNSGAKLIHAHQYTPFFYAACAAAWKRRPPILFTEHGRFHPDLPSKKRMIFNRLFLRKHDRVAAVGKAVKKALIQNEGLPADRIEVIYNGIDLTRFHLEDRQATRQNLRQTLDIKETQFVAVIVGRLDYLKDHMTAVRMAEYVKKQVPDFRLLFVGDGPERVKIEQEIERRQLQHIVTLLGTRRDIPQIMSAADVCLLTSISEGIPLTLIEGMAASLPVVATDVGGVGEVVEDEQTGYLVPAEAAEQLAQRLVELHFEESLRKQMGKTGCERAEQFFSSELMNRRYHDLYQTMG